MSWRGAEAAGAFTVADLFELPPLVAAHLEVLVGGEALANPVRWVHVSGMRGTLRFMRGGEVLLTNAGGWPTAVDGLRDVADELANRHTAGVIIELNRRFPSVHPDFVEALAAAGIALAQLRLPVDSVQVTERAHRRIIIGQTQALEARDEVHQLLIALTLRGAPADYLVTELGRILQSPVVLQTHEEEIVYVSGGDWASDQLTTLIDAPPAADAARELIRVPVAARGTEWGTLIAMPGPAHPAGRQVVLEQGAIALALERLSSRDVDHWLREASQQLLSDMLGGRYTNTLAVENRLRGLRFAMDGRQLHPVVMRGDNLPTPDQIRATARTLHWHALASTQPNDPDSRVILLSLPSAQVLDEGTARRFSAGLRAQSGASAVRLIVGSAASTPAQLISGLELAVAFADGPHLGSVDEVVFVEGSPLTGMMSAIRRDPRSRARAEQVLAPVTQYDETYRTNLVAVLIAVLSHPMSRSDAATASGMSRSSFYKRLAILEDLLARGDFGLTLNDHESILTLQLAVEVLELRRSLPRFDTPRQREG